MINMNYTSIEQSKKLLELGLNPESADMHTELFDEKGDTISLVIGGKGDNSKRNYGTLIWSAGALMEVMPPTIKPKDREESCNMEFFKGLSGKFHFRYLGAGGPTDILNLIMGTPIECAYQMVVWLLKTTTSRRIKRNNKVWEKH